MQHFITARARKKVYRLHAEDETFWRRVAAGEWEPDTFHVLARCLRSDSVYVDAGAWIGATALFAAARCRKVYCIEPDAAAYERLLFNLRVNHTSNALPLHAALGTANTRVQIGCARGLGKSMTRVQVAGENAGGESAPALSLTPSRFMDWWGIEKIDVLKIDIEGGEFDLAAALPKIFTRTKPLLHLSLHAPLFAPAMRRKKLTRIRKLAAHYAFCYDRHLREIPPREITSERFAARFDSVVLADARL